LNEKQWTRIGKRDMAGPQFSAIPTLACPWHRGVLGEGFEPLGDTLLGRLRVRLHVYSVPEQFDASYGSVGIVKFSEENGMS